MLVPTRHPVQVPSHWWQNIWSAIDGLAEEQACIVMGGRGSRFSLIALSWDEVDWQEFLQLPAYSAAQSASASVYSTGHLALVSYLPEARSRVFYLKRVLILDHQLQQAEICQEPGFERCLYHLAWPLPGGQFKTLDHDPSAIVWQSSWSDAEYLAAVAQVLAEIRAGRYYQLNLLRYWYYPEKITKALWLRQLERMGGPFSAFITMPELQLVSFSPERLFQIQGAADGAVITTEPIKGTRPVYADPEANLRMIEELQESEKDAAELNMIIDLLRNDLFCVSQASSVKVLDPGSIHSFANVHHRIAQIVGRLQAGLRMGDLVAALCPGGSITGAPKREVMQAIVEKEQRPRQYFMGNILYRDASSGRVDASILIRTAVREREEDWQFAAGSGLVIHSEPEAELEEVLSKAKVLMGRLEPKA